MSAQLKPLFLSALFMFAAGTQVRSQEPSVQITFLDVGQGDAVVIRSPEGQTAMVDAGPNAPLRFLQQMGIEEVDLLVATHPHADHIGGLVDVLTARPVRFYMDNGQPHTTATYRRLMATIELLPDVTYLEAVPRTIELGSASLEVLELMSPDVDHNNRSVSLILRFGAFVAFLSGDSERLELDHFIRNGVVPDVTLLKAPHHGSINGFTPEFLEAAQPEVVVVSVGSGNPYHHPRPEALTAFGSVADHVLRTDRDGHVTVLGYADGSFEIVTNSGDVVPVTASVPVGGEQAEQSAVSGEFATPITVTVVADAPGDDHHNLNGEYVVIQNHGASELLVGRWRLCDLSSRCFRFPDDTRIAVGRRVVVYTGYGTSNGVSFFMNNGRAVWNNDGDEATLYDEAGNAVVRAVYE